MTTSDEMNIRFLVVDDDRSIRRICATVGASLGFHIEESATGEDALQQLELFAPDIILTDLILPNMTGLQFLEQVKKVLPRVEVAIMTGHASIETAVQAMRMGAYDYIEKPFRIEPLKLLLRRMEEKVRLVAENQFLRDRMSADMALHGIIGSSAKIQDVLRMVTRMKDTRTPVLITGESGTGKELVARAIHFRGTLAQKPFVAVDCGSLVPTLVESELFGYEKGAFTGALKSKLGLFEAAQGGTIFLDEIGELPLEMQAKLLRVLQEKEVRPVGSNRSVKVDVRVIAATNRDLETAYKKGEFRKDLFFRLNVVSIHLPSLRDRRSDIPTLAHWFLEKSAPHQPAQISTGAMECMIQYDWPGNVRELENCIERALALGSGHVMQVSDLPPSIRESLVEPQGMNISAPTSSDLEELERETIKRVFDQVHGDKNAAGKLLGISRATLYRKLKRYGIGNDSEHNDKIEQTIH